MGLSIQGATNKISNITFYIRKKYFGSPCNVGLRMRSVQFQTKKHFSNS